MRDEKRGQMREGGSECVSVTRRSHSLLTQERFYVAVSQTLYIVSLSVTSPLNLIQ